MVKHQEFKDTEIGKIPKVWEVKSIKEVGTLQYGITKTAIKDNTGIKFLRITDITSTGPLYVDFGPGHHGTIRVEALDIDNVDLMSRT